MYEHRAKLQTVLPDTPRQDRSVGTDLSGGPYGTDLIFFDKASPECKKDNADRFFFFGFPPF